MGNGMNKIVSGLYLGNFRDSRDASQLSQNCITHIVSIHDNAKPLQPDKEYLCLAASDTPSQDLTQFFSQCNDFIHKARINGGSVLVHCLAGVSRSTTIVVAYLMSITDLGYRQSLDAVRGARSCASPNFGFQRQLLNFEHDGLMQQERERLVREFGASPYNDKADLLVLLDKFRESEARLSHERNNYFIMSGNPSHVDPADVRSSGADEVPNDDGANDHLAGASGVVFQRMRNVLEEIEAVGEKRREEVDPAAPADNTSQPTDLSNTMVNNHAGLSDVKSTGGSSSSGSQNSVADGIASQVQSESSSSVMST